LLLLLLLLLLGWNRDSLLLLGELLRLLMLRELVGVGHVLRLL
jgi:hypothetical protein